MIGDAVHFARPEMVAALWIWLGVWAAFIWLERRGVGVLDRLVSAALQDRLVERPALWRRRLRAGLLGLSGVAMSLALMQPQTGERFVETPRVGAEIMIALDVSRSMLADDAPPSRLERAKAEIRDLLDYLGDDHVGLIVFAGRASLVSPMTPDKSFLRLALDDVGPHSVPRGGTKIGDAIRRAVAGFGEPGPAQRVLILITDGEDHDSFPLDAAKQAAAAGIRIIAIGFGDEAGSPIFVRDERTGARVQLRDEDGNPVISRLNGELLRQIALETDGAFVPAGTGVLDLESIYEAHIAPLARGRLDGGGRTIRDEAYPFCVLAALVCLLLAVGVAAPGRASGGSPMAPTAVALALLLASLPTAPAWAQAGAAPPDARPFGSAEDPAAAGSGPGAGAAATDRPGAVGEPERSPRERFNRGNAALAAGDPVAAAADYRAARAAARDDPTLRQAAAYNLGWAAVARAEALRAENPRRALEALHEAVEAFREAVALAPDDEAARENLDVTLRRALALEDELARAEQGRIEDALDALIEAQRSQNATAARLLEAVAGGDELARVDALRAAFDEAATAQRELIDETDALADRAVREREAILAMAEDARAPEESLRAAQLEGVVTHLDAAIDRMSQTRRQLRQRRAERAYRRSAAALDELKHARDQLRDPVEQLGVLLADLAPQVEATARLAEAADAAVRTPAAERPPLPAFLTPLNVEEALRRLERRVVELGARFEQAAEAAGTEAPPPSAAPGGAGSPEAEAAARAALRSALVEAAPRVVEAGRALGEAVAAVAIPDFDAALDAEGRAARALADAQERFFDLPRLLETSHAEQARIAALASPEAFAAGGQALAPALREAQARNLARVPRLRALLAEAQARAETAAAQAASRGEGDETEHDGVAHRFARAEALLDAAAAAMEASAAALSAEPIDPDRVGPPAAAAREALDALRQLFFSLIQHLQRLARDQIDLADETREAIALAAAEADREQPPGQAGAEGEDASPPSARGPETLARSEALARAQAALAPRAGALADALLAGAEAAAGSGPDPAGATGPAPAEGPPAGGEGAPSAETLRRAADHVASAQLAMDEAARALADPAAPLGPVEGSQALAIESLAAALELLSPPPPPEDEGDQEQNPQQGGDQQQDQNQPQGGDRSQDQDQPQAGEPPQDQGPEQGEGDAGADAREDARAPEPDADAAQLLQGVRDREAERRRDRERQRLQRRAAPVDRDW